MSKLKLPWITGKRLMERWNMDPRELHILIQDGLPVYNTSYDLEDQGIIYNKTPNPDYDPKDFLPKEFIVEKNNLYDFQVLVDGGYTQMELGLTKEVVLSNLLFKLEDVENYEKENELNKDKTSKDNPNGLEFALYDSIINGELSPLLEIYSSENHIETLLEDLYAITLIKEGVHLKVAPEDIEFLDIIQNPGDKLTFTFDETDDQAPPILTKVTNDSLEDLIDIDIPPPPDLKSEYFLDLISMEYEKIKLRANKALKTASSEEQISLFANKNIQILKEIAGQAHLLSKRIKMKDQLKDPLDEPDSYIFYILKLYLIRSICFYQYLFHPFLKVPIQNEFQLRTSIYEEKHPSEFMKKIESIVREKKTLRPSQEDKINCIEIAKKVWAEYEILDIVHMIKHPEIKKIVGRQYKDKTLHNWLKAVAPARAKKQGNRGKDIQSKQEKICKKLGIII